MPQDHSDTGENQQIEKSEPRTQIEWQASPDASFLQRPFSGVFLGKVPNEGGWGSTYIDFSETPTQDGFTFGVEQSSAGYTGIFAKAAQGYSVASLTHDKKLGTFDWESAETTDDHKVRPSNDWGRLVEPEALENWDEIDKEGFGIPGDHAGIIRVTAPDRSEKFYAMSARFDGREDDWRVSGSYVEIFPKTDYSLDQSIQAAKEIEQSTDSERHA